MRNNIFIKSMLRQRVRTAILVLLVAAAAFAFVMRAVEYIVVTGQIRAISGYYRSIGFLHYEGDAHGYANVTTGADVVRDSPYLAFEDRRRGAEGTVAGMMNSHVEGISSLVFQGYTWHNHSYTDAFFYAELIGTERPHHVNPPYVEMTFRVDSVLQGYPEHVVEGQEIKMLYYLADDERAALWASREEHGEAIFPKTPVDDMAFGQRYFLRGAYHGNLSQGLPRVGDPLGSTLNMHPLNEKIVAEFFAREVSGEPLWYLPVAPGELIDPSAPGLERLDDELLLLRHHQSSVQIRTTKDMTAMPLQLHNRSWRLAAGRWIGPEDDHSENRVVMVHHKYAQMRGLDIGDTLVVGIPKDQRAIQTTGVSSPGPSTGFLDLRYDATPEENPAHELELEIVGLYGFYFDDSIGTPSTRFDITIYVPDSVLPTDLEYSIAASEPMTPTHLGAPQEAISGMVRGLPEYLPATWYSFVLNDPRDENAFIAENRDALAELGYTAHFFANGAENFWASATPILRAVTFNAIVFCAVLVLVLALVQFLYLRQRRKDIAIMRALGRPSKSIFKDLMASVLALGLPTAVIGGAAAWYFALDQASKTLNPFGEIVTARDFTLEFSISPLWLPAFVAVVLAALLAMASFGTRRILRLPVLELLQGPAVTGASGAVGAKARAAKAGTAGPTYVPAPVFYERRLAADFTGIAALPRTRRDERRAALRFVFRHIARNAAKTILAAAVALFFVIALGWLRESIRLSESEIERLYSTVIVHAEVGPENPSMIIVPYYELGNIIREAAVYGILDSGYAKDVYIEAAYQYAMVLPPDEGGGFPHDWDELTGYDARQEVWSNWDSYDSLLAFEDMGAFSVQHSRGFADEIPGLSRVFSDDGTMIGDLRIDFAEGFDESSFVHSEGEPVPVILSEKTMERWGFMPGDSAYINISDFPTRYMRDWTPVPVVIIGVHNRNILRKDGHETRDAVLAPLAFLERFQGEDIGYRNLSFIIDPSMTRKIDAIRDELGAIAEARGAGWVRLSLYMQDEELKTVVGSVEQNLALLTLLYPVAVGLSVAIGLGLSMLLMLQNAKNAAIMRVLGATKKRSAAVLCAEKLFVCIFGLAIGLSALAFIGWGLASSALLALLYLAGAMAGAAIGSVMVTNRPPLELLQVRE